MAEIDRKCFMTAVFIGMCCLLRERPQNLQFQLQPNILFHRNTNKEDGEIQALKYPLFTTVLEVRNFHVAFPLNFLQFAENNRANDKRLNVCKPRKIIPKTQKMNTCNLCRSKGQVENLALKKCQLEFLEANYLETSL